MLRIDSLTTDHGQVRAVDHVSFDVAVGSCTAVIGANGAGKSSLLRTLSGLVKATSGSASWGDIDL
ncbi:MAG: ATP-binding cassette domain-containing protein, partial [Actinobacteria bacterium]|nr:ATP-binding cassette domain-containing protein [Actinomycetota bacterium]